MEAKNETWKRTTVDIPEEMMKSLKHAATDQGITVKGLLNNIIEEYLKGYMEKLLKEK